MLIDTFISAIYIYNDKMVITFNYKEGNKMISFEEAKAALGAALDKAAGSDLESFGGPYECPHQIRTENCHCSSLAGAFHI